MPEITEIFYPHHRQEWRQWLQKHHATKTEIWLQMYRKDSGKPSLAYNDLVEECMCFGWIDGVVKKVDAESRAQRITPRRKKSFLSELNRQRFWRLEEQGLITDAGRLPVIMEQLGKRDTPLDIPDWVATQLQSNPIVWENFQAFPYFYQRLKIGWIKEAGKRREEAEKRLAYLIKMTTQNKQYGTQPLKGVLY